MTEGSTGRSLALATAGIVALALALRLWEASRSELWFDEIYTLWVARLDWPSLLRTVAHDVHPPLHFAIVKLWRALGGEASLWIKTSSVLPGVVLVGAMVWLGRAMFGTRAGLIAALLLALHGTHVMVSQEARSFAWLALWVWLAAGFAFRWIRDARAADAVGLLASEALGLWTHYLSGLVFVCLFVWGALALGRQRVRLAHWIGLHLAVTALFAPQLHTFVTQTRRDTGAHWIHNASWSSLFSLARHTAFASTALLAPFAALVAVPMMRARERAAAVMIVGLTVPVVAIGFAIGRMGGHIYTERYMYWIIPGFVLMAAAGIAGLRTRWLAWALVLVFAIQGMRVVTGPPPAEPTHLGEAQRWLASHMAPGDAIVCADTHSLFYLRQHATTLPPASLFWPGAAPPYYEGTEMIPAAWIHGDGLLDSLAAARVPWWAVRTVHGGVDSGPAAGLILRAGGRVVLSRGATTVYEGRPPATEGDQRGRFP
ncbi:MAG: glycosyltransferase family 39 protein [Candidatus Eisenbacteria bacterium]